MTAHARSLAFPATVHGASSSTFHPGMTKREYFAALAMQSFITQNFTFGAAPVARDSVQFADALIAELAKDTP